MSLLYYIFNVLSFDYPKSDKEIIPANIIAINTYCITDSFSFSKNLDRINEMITVPAPKITAAIPEPSDKAKR